MRTSRWKVPTALAGAVACVAIYAAAAHAAPCPTSSPTCFRPAFIRTGAAPIPNPPLTVEITNTDDVPGVPDVQIEMTALFGAGSDEFVKELVMNLNPSIAPSALTFTQTAGAPVASLVRTTQDAQSISPEGGFDIFFSWSTSNRDGGTLRFNENDVMKFTVSCAGDPDCGSGFGATAFHFLTAGGFRIGAHINGIPSGPCFENNQPEAGTCTSGKVFGKGMTDEVPAPAALLLVGLGLLGFGIARRRDRHVRSRH